MFEGDTPEALAPFCVSSVSLWDARCGQININIIVRKLHVCNTTNIE